MARTCRGLTAPTTSAPRHWNAESGQQQDLTPKGSERPRRSANVGVTCGAHTSDGAVRRGILARRSTGVRGQSRGRGLSRANDFFRGVSSHAPSVKRRAMVAPRRSIHLRRGCGHTPWRACRSQPAVSCISTDGYVFCRRRRQAQNPAPPRDRFQPPHPPPLHPPPAGMQAYAVACMPQSTRLRLHFHRRLRFRRRFRF